MVGLIEEIGFVDALNGLIAATSLRIRERAGESGGLTLKEWMNGIHGLWSDERFRDYFEGVDFRRTGRDWYSQTLNDQFFMLGAWGGTENFSTQERFGAVAFSGDRARRIVEKLRGNYRGRITRDFENMADVLVNTYY